MKNTNRILAISILTLVTSVSFSAEEELEEMVVSRIFNANNLTPITYTEITEEEIDHDNFGQEPSFILAKQPGITTYSDSGAFHGYSYLRLRGMDQTRINMTLDGVPLNEPEDQGVYFSNYPDFFSSLSNVQIQRGVGVALHGNASYAGSMQFSSPNFHNDAPSNLEIGLGSFNSSRIKGEYIGTTKNETSIYIRGTALESDGFKRRTKNSSQSAFVALGKNLEKHTLKLTGFHGTQENQLGWLGVPKNDLKQNRKKNGNSEEDDKFRQSLLILAHEYELNESTSIATSVYYNALDGNYDFDLNNFLGFTPTNEMYNYALDSSLFGIFTVGKIDLDNIRLSAGIHVNDYEREHVGSERSLGNLYINSGNKNELSAFVKAHYEWEKFGLFLEVQNRETEFSYRGSVPLNSIEWSFTNWKIGANYSISDQTSAYYSVAKTGREPTRTDIFGGNDDLIADSLGQPIVFVTNPEEVIGHEVGIRHKNGPSTLLLNYYHMDFENEIVLNGQFGPNGLALNEDVDESFRHGLELALNYQLTNDLSSTTSVTWSEHKIEEAGVEFEHVLSPEWVIDQSIETTFMDVDLALLWSYQSDTWLDLGNTEKLDAYIVVNARASYRWDDVELSLAINNLTDKKHFTNGVLDIFGNAGYFAGASRNYYATLKYNF